MKRLTNNALREALSAPDTGARPQRRDAFWADFKARARLHPQQQPELVRWRPAALPLYARISAALVVAVGAGWLFFAARSEPRQVIRSLEVVAPHTAVLILKDKKTDSTVLWVAGMDPEPGNGDDT